MAAKLKSKKKGNRSDSNEKIKNYYTIFSLKRDASFEENRTILQTKLDEVFQKLQSANEEQRKKLTEMRDLLRVATSKFKNKESKKLYDEQLDYAIEHNLIDTQAEQIAKDIWEEIEKWFIDGNYGSVIRKCTELLEASSDIKLYSYLSKSYFFTEKIDEALKTVDKCVEIHPKNIVALKMAARMYNDFANDIDESQRLVNQMSEINPECAETVSEQIFIYLCMGNQNMAYSLIDEYIEKNPSDNSFRKVCANDILNYSYRLFKLVQTEGGIIKILTEQVDYDTCLSLAEKAYSICTDDTVKEHLDFVKTFGVTEFNEDNRESLKWMKIGVATYGLTAIGMLLMTIGGLLGIGEGILTFLFAAALTGGLVYCIKGLIEVSNCPKWQLEKYNLTGERESKEKKLIMIGNILSGIVKFICKASWGLMKFAFRLAIPSGD